MFTTRAATVADAGLITMHRHAMFASMGRTTEPVLHLMSRSFEPWVREKMAAGLYRGWVVEQEGRVAASAGLLFIDWPPHPLHPTSDRRAYVLNVFVEPEFRQRGLAHGLLEQCVAEARRQGIEVVTLHASDAGRPIYEQMGFEPTSEMICAISAEC